MSTVTQARSGRRVVRRPKPTIDQAWTIALADFAPELHEPIRRYVENIRQGQEIRSELSTALPQHGLRWHDVSKITTKLAYSEG